MKLYFSPLSAYSQKVVMGLYEKQIDFEPILVDVSDPAARAEYTKINGYGKVPTLVLDDGHKIPESSIIVEYLDTHFDSGTRLIPEEKNLARQARFFDRLFDLYVTEPLFKIFFDGRRPEGERDPRGVADAKKLLDTSYALLDGHLGTRTWCLGDTFSMAECAAAPVLAYARMMHPFGAHTNVAAYCERLTERPSFARVAREAAPYLAKYASR